MALILFMPEGKKSSDELLQMIRSAVSEHSIEIIHSIEKLEERLQESLRDVSFAVFSVESQVHLMKIVYLTDLLGELRVVLILPDDQPDFLEKAYLLRPCFIITTENDFKHLRAILKRMAELSSLVH